VLTFLILALIALDCVAAVALVAMWSRAYNSPGNSRVRRTTRGWRMSWKDWTFALIFALLATISATLYSEYRRSKSGAVLWGVIGTLLVAILLMLVRHLPF